MTEELTQSQIELREAFQKGLEAKTKAFLVSQGVCGGKYSEQDLTNGVYYCNNRVGFCPNRGRTIGPECSLERVPYCTLKTKR